MSPENLLSHHDSASLWPDTPTLFAGMDVAAAYQQALAVRALRMARGEKPRGYKIGFTNRAIWPRYNVFAPVWGTVWNTTLQLCDGEGAVSLDGTCQPRIEPEAVFGMRATPPAVLTLDGLFDCVDWVAPGFEIVQSHRLDWKFAAPEAVADGSLHARLLVGKRVPLRSLAANAAACEALLTAARVGLMRDASVVEEGKGSNVLDGPLHALLHFAQELSLCPGAPRLQPGDVVTTGTWTDAWPVAPGQTWQADFDAPMSPLKVTFA